jgi:hypothetical protein
MATKIKTNHPFTIAQLKTLNTELAKISNTQVIALRGVSIEAKTNFADIKILHSPYLNDVFLSFTDMSVPEYPKFNLYKIGPGGSIDFEPRKNLEFNNFADRISFFNGLQPVDFHY